MSTNRRLARSVTVALAVSAIAAPTAGAYPAEIVQGSESSPPARVDGSAVVAPPAPTVTRTIDDGFDWGSAAIGAGAAAAFLLITGAGASTVSHRRDRVGAVG